MTSQTRATLKGYFNTNDQPTEAQFEDLIDSAINIVDTSPGPGTDEYALVWDNATLSFRARSLHMAVAPARRVGLLSNLANLKQGNATQICIACIGDSWTAGETWTLPLRLLLQQRLGEGGVGYVPLDIADDAPTGATRVTAGTWTDATSSYSPHIGSTSSVDFATGQKSITTIADKFVVHYRGGGGVFKYQVDAGGWTEVDTSAQSGNQQLSVTGLTVALHTLAIAPVSGAAVTFFGVDCQKTTLSGVRVSLLAKSGQSASDFAALDATAFANSLTALDPDVVLMMLGVNDMVASRTIAQYTADMTTLVTRLTTTLPNANVILVAQTESGYTGMTYPLASYAEAMREVAATEGLLFVDLHTALGALGEDPQGMFLENLHPSVKGGQLFAEIIAHELPGLLENPLLRANLSVLSGVNPTTTDPENAYTGLLIEDASTKGISNISVIAGANQITNPLLKISNATKTLGLAVQLVDNAPWIVSSGASMVIGSGGGYQTKINANGSTAVVVKSNAVLLASTHALQFCPYSNPADGEYDSGISRLAAGSLAVGNGATGDAAGKLTLAQMDVNQASTTAAVPVLTVQQADVSEEFMRFIGTSTTDSSQSLVDAANMTTTGSIMGWLKIYVQDDQATNPITDGFYYVPFYSAPTA